MIRQSAPGLLSGFARSQADLLYEFPITPITPQRVHPWLGYQPDHTIGAVAPAFVEPLERLLLVTEFDVAVSDSYAHTYLRLLIDQKATIDLGSALDSSDGLIELAFLAVRKGHHEVCKRDIRLSLEKSPGLLDRLIELPCADKAETETQLNRHR